MFKGLQIYVRGGIINAWLYVIYRKLQFYIFLLMYKSNTCVRQFRLVQFLQFVVNFFLLTIIFIELLKNSLFHWLWIEKRRCNVNCPSFIPLLVSLRKDVLSCTNSFEKSFPEWIIKSFNTRRSNMWKSVIMCHNLCCGCKCRWRDIIKEIY